jgi:TetR/AcrR family transcriptional regulator, transcriptional repressor for nem operon
MTKPGQRDLLIDAAARLFHENGFGATGARDIAEAAGVPTGSFTNHFRSKEALGVAALDRYFARLAAMMAATLGDVERAPAERLDAYFDLVSAKMAETGWRIGCLIPDLATELAARSDIVRDRLLSVMQAQVASFEAVLRELVQDDADDVAAFCMFAWHGTLLRMKVERDPAPIEQFRRGLRRLLASAGDGLDGAAA